MVVSGMLAFLLSLVVLTSRSSTITVLVAKSDIVAGKELSISQFNPRSIPSSELNNKYVAPEELTSGKKIYARRFIQAGEPLTTGAKTPDAEKNNVRTQSLPIDKSLAVDGDISSGDSVDIIQTSPDDAFCAFRVLSNLQVLSAPKASSGGGLTGSSKGFVVTVAITKPGDDVTLAGVIASGSFQVIKSTGVTSGKFIEDPICGDATQVDGYEDGN